MGRGRLRRRQMTRISAGKKGKIRRGTIIE
jgi:hypothetical protein